MGGFIGKKKRIIWSFRPEKSKQSWHKDGLSSTKCIPFSVCLAFPPFHSISCIHSHSQCVIFCECLSCGEGGHSNGPHYLFCVCVGEYFVWFYFSVCFGITRVGDCVCACVCVQTGSGGRLPVQSVTNLAAEFTWRSMTKTEDNNPLGTPVTSATSLPQRSRRPKRLLSKASRVIFN